MNNDQLTRYSRHILLPNIDLVGQKRILESSILVIGCGGLGVSSIPFLASAGVGRITCVDDDKIDLSNLQRQTHYVYADIGYYKAEVMANFVKQQNPDTIIESIINRLSLQELVTLCHKYDVILDCSDNLSTRQMINHASYISKKPLVFASAIRYEGQLSVFDFRDSQSPCYACLFDRDDNGQDSCSFYGVFAPLVGVMGSMQASEALKIITHIGKISIGKLLHYNILNSEFYQVSFEKNPECKICGFYHD